MTKTQKRVIAAAIAWAELQVQSDDTTGVRSARMLAMRALQAACFALLEASR